MDTGNSSANETDGRNRPPRNGHPARTLSLIVLLSLFWIVLSGRFDLQTMVFLAVSVAIVLWLNPERPFPYLDPARGEGLSGLLRACVRLMRFLGWLVWNVIKANVQVARIILHPRLPIDPQILVFRTGLESDLAKVMVANSITLTPGTITVDLEDDRYVVHSLAPGSHDAIESAELQNMVGAIFGESPEPIPQIEVATQDPVPPRHHLRPGAEESGA